MDLIDVKEMRRESRLDLGEGVLVLMCID